MDATAFEAAVRAALARGGRRVEGVTQQDCAVHTQWHQLGRHGRMTLDGQPVRVVEYYDSTTGEVWFLASSARPRADPLAGFRMLTTPEGE